jgi:tetratricopeptide (TPR) repeat protein/SAM-dependent methyltransferase
MASDIERTFDNAVALHKAGRLDEAQRAYRNILGSHPGHIDALHLLGVAAYQSGRSDAAIDFIGRAISLNGRIPAFHNNIALAYEALGRPEVAVSHYTEAITLDPHYVEARTNLGDLLMRQGKLDEALAEHQRALQLKPDHLGAQLNLGNVLAAQGKFDNAVEQFRLILAVAPDHPEAHMNLGNALMECGQLDQAVVHHRRALAIKPQFAKAHLNLGNALIKSGKSDEAIAHFGRALSIDPNYANAMASLASALMVKGNIGGAIEAIRRALSIEPTAEMKARFVQCVQDVRATADPDDLRGLVCRALCESWGRPNDLVGVAASLIRLSEVVRSGIARTIDAWPRRLPARELLGPSGLAGLSGDKLLLSLLESAPVCDVGLEQFLTAIRSALLDAACESLDSYRVEEDVVGLCCALARQCFINEYVFGHAEGELERAELLRERLSKAVESGAAVPVLWPVVVAMYFPLHSLPAAKKLIDSTWPDAVTRLFIQQIQEPWEEQQLRSSIPRLTIVDDPVSRLVQQQYEENPYPRWVKPAPPSKPMTIERYLRGKFPSAPLRELRTGAGIDILVAGCGTGLHSIGAAQRFSGARVLGIDLSLTSLCYALRWTRSLGLDNIEYAHADIKQLGSINREFDVIEAVGVLHHLADPMAGWQVLLSLLRPAGIMYIGLYSELARGDVIAAREFLADRGYRRTAADIRRFREELMTLKCDVPFRKICDSRTFFSTSECRDLLFHVQEHRLTLPDIKAFLAANNLQLLGFELGPRILEQYRMRFPEDEAMTDLDRWHTFERENPLTFTAMYQFWVQQKA